MTDVEHIVFKPIGIIHTPYKTTDDMPIQGIFSKDAEGIVDLLPGYAPGLKDVEGFSYIFLIYHFHQIHDYKLLTKPFLDDEPKGIFAIRGPGRPNPIGLTVVKLIEVKENQLRVRGVDMLDGTPILDIKPYIPKFDNREAESIGWLEGKLDNAP